MARIAVFDIGTVSCRLAVFDVDDDLSINLIERRVEIENLGEGVDSSHYLSDKAIKRVVACNKKYVDIATNLNVDTSICICTSAARDAKNSDSFIKEIENIGLYPQVIDGKVEAQLTFLGVGLDFIGQRIGVMDSGGGSTELCIGMLDERLNLNIDWVYSFDVGARRITEKFFRQDPPSTQEVEAAHAFAYGVYEQKFTELIHKDLLMSKLVGVGGTATSLISVLKKMETYDSSQVHLASISLDEIRVAEDLFNSLGLKERQSLVGLQPKRAAVINGGVVAIEELLKISGLNTLTVSESDLLYGLAVVANASYKNLKSPIEWEPRLK